MTFTDVHKKKQKYKQDRLTEEKVMFSCSRNKFKSFFATLLLFLSLMFSANTVTAASLFGVYTGNFSGTGDCGSGNFSILSLESNMQALFALDIASPDTSRIASIPGSAFAPDGSFSVSLPTSLFSITGIATTTSISGTFSTDVGCSGTFSGTKAADTGPLADAGGYFE